MRRNILKITIFLVLFLFMFTGLSYVMRTGGDTKNRMAGFYAEDKNTIDVLMFGASTVGSSFAPTYMWGKYGFTSYPLSSNSQRPKAIRYMMEEGLKYQKPSLLVIEMRGFVAEDETYLEDEGHLREVFDNMRYSATRIDTINGLTETYDDKYSFYVDLFKYHSNYGNLMQPSEWSKFFFVKKDIYKGFEMLNHQEPYRRETPYNGTDDIVPLPQSQEAVLKDLLDYLKSTDYKVLFVVTPRAPKEDYEEQMNYAANMVREAGYDFIDLNYMYDEMGFDYKYDIDDGAHTNAWGAVKCSDVLGQYINDNYDLPKNYSEKTKKEWDKAYEVFMDDYNNLEPILKSVD